MRHNPAKAHTDGIIRDPDSIDAKLVYADYLDECSDIQGTLIRACLDPQSTDTSDDIYTLQRQTIAALQQKLHPCAVSHIQFDANGLVAHISIEAHRLKTHARKVSIQFPFLRSLNAIAISQATAKHMPNILKRFPLLASHAETIFVNTLPEYIEDTTAMHQHIGFSSYPIGGMTPSDLKKALVEKRDNEPSFTVTHEALAIVNTPAFINKVHENHLAREQVARVVDVVRLQLCHLKIARTSIYSEMLDYISQYGLGPCEPETAPYHALHGDRIGEHMYEYVLTPAIREEFTHLFSLVTLGGHPARDRLSVAIRDNDTWKLDAFSLCTSEKNE